jgi:hypothetical protein
MSNQAAMAYLAHSKVTHKDTRENYSTITFKEIADLCEKPSGKPKGEAAGFIPSSYIAHDARVFEVQTAKGQFHALCLDIDNGIVKLETLTAAISDIFGDVAYIIYSTSSASKTIFKWRGIIPLGKPISGKDYAFVQGAFFEMLEAKGIVPDYAFARSAQVMYLPNIPPDRRDPTTGEPKFYQYAKTSGKPPANVGADHPIYQKALAMKLAEEKAEAEAKVERDKRAAARAAKAAANPGEVSAVDAFNANHTIEQLLDKYGYKNTNGSQHWQSPLQTSGGYSTKNFGEHWVSLSESDVNAGIGAQKKSHCWGDAFDLFVHYEHGGDYTAAVRAYGREIDSVSSNIVACTKDPFESLPKPVPPARAHPEEAEVPAETQAAPKLELVLDRHNRPVLNAHNIREMMVKDPAWDGVLAFDSFAQRKMVTKPVPGSSEAPKGFKGRDLADSDAIDATTWFNRNGFPSAGKGLIQDEMDAMCRRNVINPVKMYLEDVAEKYPSDSEANKLLGIWAIRYLGVDPKGDDQLLYVCDVSRKWLVSAVARAISPGCKADSVLILEGSQGLGKSSALRILAGDDWFGDALPPMATKDASDYIRGKWIIEMAELSNINKAEVEVVKAFVSRAEERFRPAYGRNEVTYPRACVFAGSTNKSDYLRDETGNRRFWPLRCGAIDLDGLGEARDKLWAAAYHAYQAKEEWWLSGYAEAIARREQDKRLSEDVWADEIRKYCDGRIEVSVKEILADAMHITVDKVGRQEQNRATAALASLGFEKDGRFTSGDQKGRAKYSRISR